MTDSGIRGENGKRRKVSSKMCLIIMHNNVEVLGDSIGTT